MKRLLMILVVLAICYSVQGALVKGFRPPAVPLITNDPYFSVWSPSTNLTDSWPMLWDGTTKAFVGLIRIDGNAFRFMGPSAQAGGSLPNPMQQTSCTVYPTRTVYTFQQNGIMLTVTFTSPMLTTSHELLSRPVTYLTFDVVSTDGKSHAVKIYYDNTAEIAVNTVDETVRWMRTSTPNNLVTLRVGTDAQNVLGRSGDGVGIDWGYMYVATGGNGVTTTMANALDARNGFATSGNLPGDNMNMPVPASQNWPVLAVALDLGSVGSQNVERVLLLAYDDIYSMNYFGIKMQAYWKTLYADILHLLDQAWKDYPSLIQQAENFDTQLINNLGNAGGDQYATIASLSYRQTIAGTKLVWHPVKNTLWYFMKEISSDGDVSTVDVIFPASPMFLYFDPNLLSMMLLPIFDYANNDTTNPYSLVWAPHHLGTWPVANIQTGQQENMPIEETANMLLMIASIVKRGTNLDFVKPYWPLLVQWANYLISALPDPENQLCTDDFEGPIPHDANLALKGILGLGAFAQLCQENGNTTASQYYMQYAQSYAQKWMAMANPSNTNYYRLRYDQDGWSLKYNMLFQYVLGLKVFPQSVTDMEVAYYLTKMNHYGTPLDVRGDFTKLDWQSWVAAIATKQSDFLSFINCIYNFANDTPQRVPLSDWYYTSTAKQTGFQARTVVGGVYAKMIIPKP